MSEHSFKYYPENYISSYIDYIYIDYHIIHRCINCGVEYLEFKQGALSGSKAIVNSMKDYKLTCNELLLKRIL